MCLIISKEQHHAKLGKDGRWQFYAKVAGKNPIKCFKHLELSEDFGDTWITPYQYIPVEFNKDGIAPMYGRGFINVINCDNNGLLPAVYCGIHAYQTREESKYYLEQAEGMEWHYKEFPSIIPSGEEYFVGKHGDIVASKMLVFKRNYALNKFLNGTKPIVLK